MIDALRDPELSQMIAELAEITGEAPLPLLRRMLRERLERLRRDRCSADELGEIAVRNIGLGNIVDGQPDSISCYRDPGAGN